MKAGLGISFRSLQLSRPGRLIVVFVGILTSSVSAATEPKLPYDERLLPVATTFLDLQLCSNFAVEFEENEELGGSYSAAAWALYDFTIERGWSKDLFASAMVVAHEAKSLLEVAENETRESFNRRNYSGKPCDQAMERAESYTENSRDENACQLDCFDE